MINYITVKRFDIGCLYINVLLCEIIFLFSIIFVIDIYDNDIYFF